MSSMKSRTSVQKLDLLVWVAFGVYFALLIAYFIAFRDDGCCSAAAWGQFGDFIGGTLNPALGIASVFMLVATLREQRAVLEDARQRADVEEMQRQLFYVAQGVDEALARPLDPDSDAYVFAKNHAGRSNMWPSSGQTLTVRHLLELAQHALRQRKMDFFDAMAITDNWSVDEVRAALVRMDTLLELMQKRGQEIRAAEVYGLHYRASVVVLRALDAIGMYPPGIREYPHTAVERLGLTGAFGELASGIARIHESLEEHHEKQKLLDAEFDQVIEGEGPMESSELP